MVPEPRRAERRPRGAGKRPGLPPAGGPPAGTRTVFWVTCVQAAPPPPRRDGPLRPRPRLAGWAEPHLVAGDGDQVHGVVHCLEDAQDGAQGLLQVLGALAALAVFQHLLGGAGGGSLPVWTLSSTPPGRAAGTPWDKGVAPVRLSLVGQDRCALGHASPA